MLTNWPESQTTWTVAPVRSLSERLEQTPARCDGWGGTGVTPDPPGCDSVMPTVTFWASESAQDGAPARSATKAGRTRTSGADRMAERSAGTGLVVDDQRVRLVGRRAVCAGSRGARARLAARHRAGHAEVLRHAVTGAAGGAQTERVAEVDRVVGDRDRRSSRRSSRARARLQAERVRQRVGAAHREAAAGRVRSRSLQRRVRECDVGDRRQRARGSQRDVAVEGAGSVARLRAAGRQRSRDCSCSKDPFHCALPVENRQSDSARAAKARCYVWCRGCKKTSLGRDVRHDAGEIFWKKRLRTQTFKVNGVKRVSRS